ncbi:hypothetical protein SCLCIDRAFT_1211458 [Scleroderma citrinum Foug A]|uniref:Uncharacterized protein n=1 Tax=Scleroderma citrinum Foug A TaxID=1036808 RepID=A0A0C3E0C4_9AGAM|nr:hypothetical protein SCLCIDRAFT_1211458 [Scleroderma citrinum Foug A]
MSSSAISHLPLDYLQASPVRGQLEPHDEASTKPGWRFLQCTDTPNELKVLLPPRTAQFYAILLKAELNELAKKRDASWERILDIRRLKDRMIRKCQRLAHAYSVNTLASRVPFLTLHAPSDFRLKEMEKWIRGQEGADAMFKKVISSDGVKQRAFCCDRCANLVPSNHTVSHRRLSSHSVHSRRSSVSDWAYKAASSVTKHASASRESFNKSSSSMGSVALHEAKSQESRVQQAHVHEHSSIRDTRETMQTRSHEFRLEEDHIHRSSKHHQSTSVDASTFVVESKFQQNKRDIHVIPEDPHEYSTTRSNHSTVENHHEVESTGRLSIISPDPLPIPCNGSLSAAFKDMVTSPVDIDYQGIDADHGKKAPSEGSRSPPSEEESADGSRAENPRRRSSLKRSNSELRMSMAYSTKTVSWAMDRDWSQQISKYHDATQQVDFADHEWGVVCDNYREELSGLRVLRRNVTETLSKLKLETEKLQREDEVIRDQEDKLRAGFEQLEQKHDQYKAKVTAVLQETEQVLALCGTKRDGQT